jgi:hypothetical protein
MAFSSAINSHRPIAFIYRPEDLAFRNSRGSGPRLDPHLSLAGQGEIQPAQSLNDRSMCSLSG